MIAPGGSRPFDWFALPRRSRMERQNTPAGPRNVRGGRLSIVLSFGAIAIGITALTGYFLASASIAALSAHGKPVAAVTALALIVLGGGLLALHSPAPAGVSTARRAVLFAVVLAAANLLSAALSPKLDEWQVWAARGGVLLHSYAVTAILILALGAALFLVTTRRDFAGHVIASMVLLICIAFLFAYVLRVPAFLDPVRRVAPVLAATVGLALISVSELLVRPRGWVVPLLSRTPTGLMTRVLLLATLTVPFLADGLRDLIAGMRWWDVDVDHAVVVDVVEVFFTAALVLALGLMLHRRESDRMRLASIVESSGDAIIGTSSAGLIESWNAGAQAMFGYTAAEAIGRSVALLAPPERRNEASRILERIRLGEHPDAFETVRASKDGSLIDVWVSVSPMVDDAGGLVGASAIVHDITRRKRAEEAMVESEARYRTLVENLPQKVMLKDRNSVYVSANEAYARDLGLEPKAVAGKTDYDFFPQDLAAKYRADDARIMEAGVTEDLEEEYVEGGQRRFIHTVKTPVRDPHGNVTNILVILWDITAKRLAEDQLQKAIVELERSNRELARSEAALKEAQRIAQVGHWESSVVTGAVAWSDEHYRILGIPIGSVAPSHELFLGMMDAENRRREVEAVARALASSDDANSETEIDVRVTTPAGASLVLSQRVFVDRDDAGKVMGFRGTIQDITRRVATEQALRDSEAALAEAQEIAHIGSWVLDAESGLMQVSAEAFRIFAVEPLQDASMQIFLDRLHGEDRATLEAAIAASLQTGTLDVEVRIVTPDGTRVAHIVARKRGAGEGRPGLIGTTQDITKQKSAEEAIRQRTESMERSNAELERFNRLAIGREMRMVELKQQIDDLCGQLGQPAPYVLPEERASAMETSMAVPVTDVTAAREQSAALAGKVEEALQSRVAALNMMEDAVDAARSLERANRDLKQQMSARRELEESHRRLFTVVEQSSEVIIVTGTSGVIEYVNPAFERVTGYTRDEAVGQTPRILKSGKQDDAFYKTLWSTIKGGSDWHGRFTNRRKDGSLYEEDTRISPVRDNDGTITNFVAMNRDVTEEVALGEQLRHAQKIEAIGTLAGGVAHDFNNLLQAMLSIVQLLKGKSSESPRQIQHLTQLEKTIRRGASLTRQLLLFARREISRRETLDLNEILRDLLEFLRRVVRANIRLSVEPASVPLWISTDRGQIEQVIMNLALNAIDAMSAAGALSIVAGRDEHAAWLEVTDTGTGIPETIRDRIFEPFFTTKEAGKGTGLGLAVVHGIIAAHEGRIEVECPPEGGTTFRVELPLHVVAAEANGAVASAEDIPNGNGERVLLVEDEQGAREGLSGILQLLGYTVVAAETGEEALGMDEQVPVSVLLTDFMLPGMPGIEVVRRLRERWPDLKAIVMSGYAPPGLIDAAVAANEFQFLQKPFDMAELARTLRAVLLPVAQG